MEDGTPRLPSVGDVVGGKYRVDRVIGRGGMGTVLAVRHLGLDEARALKLMLPRGLELPQARERFFREARAAAKLRSEHAVAVHDVGVLPDGFPYIEMELLEGTDLAQLVKRSGAVPVASAVEWIAQACDAVGEAHALGIVHRDLKPGNLFLCRTQSGRELIKVLDFGIAKTSSADTDPTLTGTNASFGSPMYMSPEQMRGARYANPRSDIWGLGVVLFELLTGKRPFAAESVTALALIVTSEPAPHPTSLRADIPGEVDAIVMRCLDKDPERRFGSAAELSGVLRASIGLAVPQPRGSLASLPGPQAPAPARAPTFAVAPIPAAPISQPSQPSQPSQLSQASQASSPSFGHAPWSMPAPSAPASAQPSVPSSQPSLPSLPSSQPSLPSSQPSLPSSSQPSLASSHVAMHAAAPLTSSRPSMATLSTTVGGPGRPRPAFLAAAAVMAGVLGLVIALVAWRVTSGSGAPATSASGSPVVAAAPSARAIEPTPPAAADEPASPLPAPSPASPAASSSPSTADPPASSASAVAVASAPRPLAPSSATRPGKLPTRPKTGFGGID